MATDFAAGYLLERSAELEIELPSNCIDEACRIAALLRTEGKRPWIGRLRDRRVVGGEQFSGLLYPVRFSGRGAIGWTTHYVACAGDVAYEPIAGEPVAIASIGDRLFRISLEVEEFLSSDEVDGLLRSGALRDELLARVRAAAQTPPLA